MPLNFKSICSSSRGNCLILWTDNTKLVIDCGLGSMKRTRAVLSGTSIDSILITHTHGDHISYYPLRVLEECGHPVCLHDDCVNQLKDKHFTGIGLKKLNIKPYTKKKFIIGEFQIQPFEVVHNPSYLTHGFEIYYKNKKIVIATDFCEWSGIFDKFLDSDFIFVESNHDLGLLEQNPNPNSQYHMPNPDTAELLINVIKESKKVPQAVMLGHISDQRNKSSIALKETANKFEEHGIKMDFRLLTAPLYEISEVVKI
jgi:phosphoribosyl 1,2-cyclic phosphodiesterase